MPICVYAWCHRLRWYDWKLVPPRWVGKLRSPSSSPLWCSAPTRTPSQLYTCLLHHINHITSRHFLDYWTFRAAVKTSRNWIPKQSIRAFQSTVFERSKAEYSRRFAFFIQSRVFEDWGPCEASIPSRVFEKKLVLWILLLWKLWYQRGSVGPCFVQ